MSYRVDYDIGPLDAAEQLRDRVGAKVEVFTKNGVRVEGRLLGADRNVLRLLDAANRSLAFRTNRIDYVDVKVASWKSNYAHAVEAKTERFTIRLRPLQLQLVREAARIRGITISSFVLSTVVKVAKEIVSESRLRRRRVNVTSST